jgi:AcrR family transcriptional regulator
VSDAMNDPSNVPKPRRADAQRNRDAILRAARAAFESGDDDLRFDDFAALAGVGTGTLYRHFPTRDALAAAVYSDEVTALCDRAAELRHTLPAAQALATLLRELVDYLQPGHGLGRTLATLMASQSDALSAGARDLERAVVEVIAAGVAEGVIRADVDPGAVMMALHGIGAAQDRPHWRREADDLVTTLLDGLTTGVAPSS